MYRKLTVNINNVAIHCYVFKKFSRSLLVTAKIRFKFTYTLKFFRLGPGTQQGCRMRYEKKTAQLVPFADCIAFIKARLKSIQIQSEWSKGFSFLWKLETYLRLYKDAFALGGHCSVFIHMNNHGNFHTHEKL